jgi:hypothetical protein
MKKTGLFIILSIMILSLKAQPAINDEPCNAIQLPITQSLNYQTYPIDSATHSAIPSTCNDYSYIRDIWFYFYFPSDVDNMVIDMKANAFEILKAWDCNSFSTTNQFCVQGDSLHITYFLHNTSLPNEPIYLRIFSLTDSVSISIHKLAVSPLIVTYATDFSSLLNNFVQSGITVNNITYHGSSMGIGGFSNGSQTNLGLDQGIILSSGDVKIASDQNYSTCAGCDNGAGSDSDLAVIHPGYQIYDASVLEFDVIPMGNMLSFNYIFASEEYPEYVYSTFNDVLGFFLSGPNPTGENYNHYNIALVPGTNDIVCINNINSNSNSQFYVDNTNGTTIQYDGFTTVLPATVIVVPYQTYHLKIAIGDCGDHANDSGVFLQSQSFQSYNLTGISNNIENNSISVFPCPLNEQSVLRYNLNEDEYVSIILYNVIGEKEKILVSNIQKSGDHTISLRDIKKKGIHFIQFSTKSAYKNLKILVE